MELGKGLKKLTFGKENIESPQSSDSDSVSESDLQDLEENENSLVNYDVELDNVITTKLDYNIKQLQFCKNQLDSLKNQVQDQKTKDNIKKMHELIQNLQNELINTDQQDLILQAQEGINQNDMQYIAENWAIPLRKRTESVMSLSEISETSSKIGSAQRKANFKRLKSLSQSIKSSALQFQVNPFNYEIQEIKQLLQYVATYWSFDTFFLEQLAQEKPFLVISNYLMTKLELYDYLIIDEEKAQKYFVSAEKKYLKNPYHNSIHGCDVSHSTLFFIFNSDLCQYLRSIDLFAILIATLNHDIAHPGVTNRFLVNTKDELAITYNDMSVLENMHCATTFKLAMQENQNIFENFSDPDYMYIRKIIIELILATDMAKHFEFRDKFKNKFQGDVYKSLDSLQMDEIYEVIKMCLKCSDIGHSAKNWPLHFKWSKKVCEEFFNQGDIEKSKGLPVSMYCDRVTTQIDSSQHGFLQVICIPLFSSVCSYLNSKSIDRQVLQTLFRNAAAWKRRTQKKHHSNILKKAKKAEKLEEVSILAWQQLSKQQKSMEDIQIQKIERSSKKKSMPVAQQKILKLSEIQEEGKEEGKEEVTVEKKDP